LNAKEEKSVLAFFSVVAIRANPSTKSYGTKEMNVCGINKSQINDL
jgi:hypothetical protein